MNPEDEITFGSVLTGLVSLYIIRRRQFNTAIGQAFGNNFREFVLSTIDDNVYRDFISQERLLRLKNHFQGLFYFDSS